MSQNIVALIIFLALIALAVIGTLAFSALVDRGERKRRSKVTRHRENDRDRTKDASQSSSSQSGSYTKQGSSGDSARDSSAESGESGDDSGGEREESR